jgi:hypothetical protein
MKHIHDLAISELGRLLCGRFTLGQFRPDQVPVVRAKIFASDLAVGDLLDGCAVLDGDLSALTLPLPDSSLCDAKGSGEGLL